MKEMQMHLQSSAEPRFPKIGIAAGVVLQTLHPEILPANISAMARKGGDAGSALRAARNLTSHSCLLSDLTNLASDSLVINIQESWGGHFPTVTAN